MGKIRCCCALLIAASGLAEAQSFEVATVKAADPAETIAFRRSGHRIVTTGTSLEWLITWAYDLHGDRVVGKPKWLDSARYDVTANAPVEDVSGQRLQRMMQTLLKERFGLAVHGETRDMAGYALVVDKGGFKPPLSEAPSSLGQNPFAMPGRGRLIGTQVTAAALAKVLAGQLGRTVEDETGLRGVFDFRLEWSPDGTGEGASLFTAVTEQLGLKLEGRRHPVEALVIDHVERTPTEN